MEENKPPEYYFSVQDFGPVMHLPVSKPLTAALTVSEGYQPMQAPGQDIYEYTFHSYEPEHHWARTEPYADFGKRIRSEVDQERYENDLSYYWLVEKSISEGYPRLAAIIVTIAPCWVYHLWRKI